MTFAANPLPSLASLPASLSGASGANRADLASLQLEVQTDLDAVACFLREYAHSPGTHRIYQRECERLHLWAVLDCQKPLSSLTRQDFEGYLHFLADPQPAALWCAPKTARSSAAWRPFVGPLSDAAIQTAVAAVNSLLSYLVAAGYLRSNPLALIRQKKRLVRSEPKVTDTQDSVERFLDEQMWMAVTQAVEALPRESSQELAEYERARFILAFLYLMAPRAGELEAGTMNSFQERHGRWWWHVTGKGQKVAKVPVPDPMMDALVRYRQFLGLPAVPSADDSSPLLRSIRNASGITARRLNQVLKKLFNDAAALLPAGAAHKAAKLRQASAHWGRHTGITAKVNAGMDPRYVQKDARHSDARTTAMYTHEEDDRWHEEAQKQNLPWG